jgi:hypothetical protein
MHARSWRRQRRLGAILRRLQRVEQSLAPRLTEQDRPPSSDRGTDPSFQFAFQPGVRGRQIELLPGFLLQFNGKIQERGFRLEFGHDLGE